MFANALKARLAVSARYETRSSARFQTISDAAGARRWPRALIVVIVLGLVLRLATLAIPSIQHPDETYQYLEAAHREAFGYGVVTWEYRLGMRSWLLPSILAGPMLLGNAIAPGTGLYYLLPRLLTALAATTIILSAWTLGARISRRHALFAAIVAATWYELVAFAGHPIGEATGLSAGCGAAALMFGPNTSRARLVWAGALVALTLVLRFQYAPALLVLVVFAGGRDIRARWLPMVAGGLAVMLVSALVDIAHGTLPFGWLIENIHQNIALDKAARFGEAEPTAYIGALGEKWRIAAVPILIAAYAGMKRQPALFWAAIVHFVVHSLIGHKEYRFILLTDGFAILLAAIGTVDLIDALQARLRRDRRRALTAAALALWIGTSVTLAALPWNRPLWTARATTIARMTDLRADPALCGVAILGVPISEFGGYAALHRNVPIYILDSTYPHQRETGRRFASAFNTMVVTGMRQSEVPPGFASEGCRSTAGEYIGHYTNPEEAGSMASICTYRRPGGCDSAVQRAGAELTVNPVLVRSGM